MIFRADAPRAKSTRVLRVTDGWLTIAIGPDAFDTDYVTAP